MVEDSWVDASGESRSVQVAAMLCVRSLACPQCVGAGGSVQCVWTEQTKGYLEVDAGLELQPAMERMRGQEQRPVQELEGQQGPMGFSVGGRSLAQRDRDCLWAGGVQPAPAVAAAGSEAAKS